MIVVESPDLKGQMLEVLRNEYRLGEGREGIHVSDLTYCLTKSYWKRSEPEPPTEAEIGLWGIGWALERVMISRLHIKPLELDGITGTPDFAFPDGTPADLKTTRLSPAGRKGEGGFQMPEGWLRQFKAYRHMLNQQVQQAIEKACSCPRLNPPVHGPDCASHDAAREFGWGSRHDFGVVVVHLIQPELKVWRLQFSDAELEENWQWLVDRSNKLENMIANDDPQPFEHRLGEWECTGCAYQLKCVATQMAGRF